MIQTKEFDSLDPEAISQAILDNSFPLINKSNCGSVIKSGSLADSCTLLSLFEDGIKLASNQKKRIKPEVATKTRKLTDELISNTIPSGN